MALSAKPLAAQLSSSAAHVHAAHCVGGLNAAARANLRYRHPIDFSILSRLMTAITQATAFMRLIKIIARSRNANPSAGRDGLRPNSLHGPKDGCSWLKHLS
jgi:hypothetical protein